MYCTSCGSPNMQRLSMVYASGFRDQKGTVIGFGRGLFVGRNRGTSQSRLSQIAAPPRPRNTGKFVGIWVSIGLLASWLGLLTWAQNVEQQRTQTAHVRHSAVPRPSVQLSPESVFILKSFGALAVTVYVLSLPLCLRSIRRFNRNVYVPAMRRWELFFHVPELWHDCRNARTTVSRGENRLNASG